MNDDEHDDLFNESGMLPDPWFTTGSSDYAELLQSDPSYEQWANSYSEESLRMMDADASFLINLTESERSNEK